MIPGFEYETPTAEQIAQTVEEMMEAGDDDEKYLASYSKHVKAINQSSVNISFGIYSLMDHDGNFYVGWETSVHRVSDNFFGDIKSVIEITCSFDLKDGLPPEEGMKISRIMAMGMTYDGFLAVAMPGIIAVLDRNLGNMQYILLENQAVDNGISIDKDGGNYRVTSKYMRKLVLDGKTLSDKDKNGAWKSEYDHVPNPIALSRGAGNTPALMGFVPDEDHLVFLTDAGVKIKVATFWRDEIPKDFVQKPGTKSNRIADRFEHID